MKGSVDVRGRAMTPGEKAHYRERVIEMSGAQGPVFGVLAEPQGSAHESARGPADGSKRDPVRVGVLIVAGQPQTRVGSHRMFTDLARMLAAEGVCSLRFDIGGWGDSPGEALPFEASDRDISAAAARLSTELQADSSAATRVLVLGLCDGASAAVLALPALRAAGHEPQALVLVNPWVRSEASLSDAMVRTYYARRLFQREFWARLLSGRVSLTNLVREPLRHLAARFGGTRFRGGRGQGDASSGTLEPTAPALSAEAKMICAAEPAPPSPSTVAAQPAPISPAAAAPDLPTLLLAQLDRYAGKVLTVLSGNDLTAGETESLMSREKQWRRRLERGGEILRVPGADHTFSDPAQWASVARWVAERTKQR